MANLLNLSTCVLGLAAFGCGGKSPAPSGPPATSDVAAINGCTSYKDMTDAGAYSIPWNESIASSDLRCIKIRVGHTVGFTGNFTTHPMKAANGGTPNPFDQAIANVSNPGSDQEQTNMEFPTAGTYGYVCGVHPAMTGAVVVVP